MERDSLGLDEPDQDSVSEDGGKKVSVGTQIGWAGVIPGPSTGVNIATISPFQGLNSELQSTKRASCFFEDSRSNSDSFRI